MKVGMIPSQLRRKPWLSRSHLVQIGLIGLLLTVVAWCVHSTTAYAQTDGDKVTQEQEVNGYEYTVQPGDNWSAVAARTNTTVAELKAANPRAAGRASGWLITGERLFIPVATRMMTTTHVVEYGDSWSTIAKAYGISMQLLKAANPKSLRYDDVLYRGETLFVPLVDESVEATDATAAPAAGDAGSEEGAEESTPTPAATTVEEAAEEATETPEESATAEPTAEATEEAEVTTTATAEADTISCPVDYTAYPAQLLALLAREGNVETLSSFLDECGVAAFATVANQDLTGDGIDDYVVVYPLAAPGEEDADSAQLPMDLVILNSGADGYTVGHQARAESAVQLLSTLDVNSDGQSDVVWTETTCGAADCFQTILVYSWDGTAWRNWTAEKVTMANAEIRLEDMADEGQGLELVLDGGIYESEAAGPQRAHQELWGSVDGAPYTLLSTTVAESNCLYHTVLDANAAFLTGGEDEFASAEARYTDVISDDTLIACGTHPNEIEELRSFGIYRLALISAYQGMPLIASDLIENLALAFPGSLYDQVGQVWLEAYQENYEIATACAAVDQFVAANPDTLTVLADYGFANPTFTAADVCPQLDVTIPPLDLPTPEPTPVPPTPTPVEEAAPTEVPSEEATGEQATDDAVTSDEAASDDVAADDTATTDVTTNATVTEGSDESAVAVDDEGLPLCPETLGGYSAALPIVLTTAAGDPLIVETWLRSCNAMDDSRGSFRLVDLNGDGFGDAIFLPTIVSDLGFGRDGAQGAVLIYHGNADGEYTLVANPEIYGEPRLLTIDDLNNDRVPDIAWSIEGCSSFCVLEVQVVTWAADTYTTTIVPGATITEGEADFEPVPNGSLGNGQQLVLTGGVSGTPDGGLPVPHTEIWQSINRGPFQRISWTYDRSVAESNCMGLRLVEADVALQASAVVGYEPAIELYTSSIDPTLKACSIYEMTAEEELMLLQGLATFRLIQAQALSGDIAAAKTTLQSLQQGQPDSDFSAVAETWLTSYENDGDAAAACEALLETFEENEELWQITDNYGYNHPALGPEQICFVPAG